MGPRPSSPLKPSATRKPAHATSSGWGTRRRHRPARRLYPQAIEEIQFSVSPIALAEAYDSELPEAEYRTFAGDLNNLTIAALSVNHSFIAAISCEIGCEPPS